jgi:hypothetical protein
MAPTAGSATTLIRDGTADQQALGACSIIAQAVGLITVTVFLHPTFFGANWVSEDDRLKWVDGQEPGYVKHYGLLFIDYRGRRHLFIIVELLMSTETGILRSYQATQSNCRDVVTAAAAVSAAYLLAIGVLRPHLEFKDRVFFTAIAGIETFALTTQAFSLWLGSEETQAKTRTVAESAVMVAEWALTIKSLYDIGRRIKSIYDYFRVGSLKTQPLSVPFLSNYDEELGSLGVASEALVTSTTPPEINLEELLSAKSDHSQEILSDRSTPTMTRGGAHTFKSNVNPLDGFFGEAAEAL